MLKKIVAVLLEFSFQKNRDLFSKIIPLIFRDPYCIDELIYNSS